MESVSSSSSSEKVTIEKIKELLPQFNPDRKVAIMWKFIRAPIFDYNLLYHMLITELEKNKKSSDVASSSHDHHQVPNNNNDSSSSSSVVGVELMQKSTLLQFKVRPIPPVPTFSAPGNNNVVVKNKIPTSSKSDNDDQHVNNNIIVAATTLSSLDKDMNFIKNQKPLVGHQQDKTKFNFVPNRKVASTSLDKNNVIKNQIPVVGNPQKIAPKRQRIDLDDCYDHDEEEKSRAKKRNKKKKNNTRSVVAFNVAACTSILPPQELQQVMNIVKGCDPVLVIHKRLYQSDVNTGLARLSLPLTQVNPQFLTEDEKKNLLKGDTIDAQMFEPCGEQCVITLTKWNMTKSCTYNLIKTWNDVVRRNGLEQGTQVQLWSFRAAEGQLCLFLAKL